MIFNIKPVFFSLMRIIGVKLKLNQKAKIIPKSFYGMGSYKSLCLIGQLGLNKNKKAQFLKAKQWNSMILKVEREPLIGGKLKRLQFQNIAALKKMSSYRGIRHTQFLPVRGQRTKTNANTCRRFLTSKKSKKNTSRKK